MDSLALRCRQISTRRLLALLIVAAAIIATRAVVLSSPFFEDIQYERAPMGLQALAILRGEPPVMNWSEPYHGSVFSYLLAPFYLLKTDPVRTYSWVSVLFNLLGVFAAYRFARRIWGPRGGLATLGYLAVPPLFFTFHDVNSYAIFVTLGSLAALNAYGHLADQPGNYRRVWAAGVLLGLATWCHQLGIAFVVAIGVTFLAVERLRFLRGNLWRLSGGFLIGAAPIIAWNAINGWIVVRNFTSSDYAAVPIREAVQGVKESVGSLLAANFCWFWPPGSHSNAWTICGEVVFLVLAGFAVLTWVRSPRERRIGLGLLIALVFTTMALYSKSRWGVGAGMARYLIPICAAVPIFAGGLIASLAERSRAIGAAVLLMFLAIGAHDHWRFLQFAETGRGQGAKRGIELLDRLGVTKAYANVRVALPLTLAARERIIVSDYDGIPYYPYLNAVDDAAAPAIVTHKQLQIPAPDAAERSLAVLGGRFRRAESGPYVVFYDFQPPELAGGWLAPAEWQLTANANEGDLAKLVDRDMLTPWSTNRAGKPGDWVAVDLRATHRVNEVVVLTGVRITDAPIDAVLETSLDGEHWSERQRLSGMPWYWWNGHPKLSGEGRISFYFPAVEARHLRLQVIRAQSPYHWSIAELFVRAADAPRSTAGEEAFREGILAEHRGSVGINYHCIHSDFAPLVDTTPWAEVMDDCARAIAAAPNDPEAHYLLGKALWVNAFLSPSPSEQTAVHFTTLGLATFALRECRAWATIDPPGSYCVDVALANTRDGGDGARLREVSRHFTPELPRHAAFGQIELLGTGTFPDSVSRGERFAVDLFWKASRSLPKDYAVFVHFDGPRKSHFSADHAPAGGQLPTSAWQEGETVRDHFAVEVPRTIETGDYRVTVGLYDRARRKRLRGSWFGASEITVATIRVPS
jgi:hypothetical protein